MRRQEKQIHDPEQIEAVIRAATVCFLALCDGDQPYVVPLNFGHAEGALYFHSAVEGRKLDLIRRCPRVGFALEAGHAVVSAAHPCNWSVRYRSVVGEGRAVIVTDPAQKRFALDRILAQYGAGPGDYDERRLAATCIFRVDIDRMTGKQSG